MPRGNRHHILARTPLPERTRRNGKRACSVKERCFPMPCSNERQKRNIPIALRVALKENRPVNLLVKTANLTKQEYIMSILTDTAIVVQSSTRAFKVLKDSGKGLRGTFAHQACRGHERSKALTERLELLTDMLQDLGAKIPQSQLGTEESKITEMRREG